MPKSVQIRSKWPEDVQYQPISFSNALPLALNPHSDPEQHSRFLHYHNVIEISLCTSGSGIFFLDDSVFPYREGSLFQIAPNILHAAHREEGQYPSWLTLYLDLGYLGTLQSSEGIPLQALLRNQVLDALENHELSEIFSRLSREHLSRDSLSKAVQKGYLQVLLSLLTRNSSQTVQSEPDRNPHLPRIAPALNCIAANLDKALPVGLLARECNMSESHFRRKFSSIIGESPHQYLLNTRIQFAKSLLHDHSISVLDVAQRCGFESLSTFNRAFRKHTGMCPRQWRKFASKIPS